MIITKETQHTPLRLAAYDIIDEGMRGVGKRTNETTHKDGKEHSTNGKYNATKNNLHVLLNSNRYLFVYLQTNI